MYRIIAPSKEEKKEVIEESKTAVAEETYIVEDEPIKEEVVEQPIAVVAPKKEEPKKIVSAPASTSSEAVSIMGTVVEQATGFPIIGANIIQKGTSNGTITDFDGNFVMRAEKDVVLLISYVGYQDQEVRAAQDSSDLSSSMANFRQRECDQNLHLR